MAKRELKTQKKLSSILLVAVAALSLWLALWIVRPIFEGVSSLIATVSVIWIPVTVLGVVVLIGGLLLQLWSNKSDSEQHKFFIGKIPTLLSILLILSIIWVFVCTLLIANQIIMVSFYYWSALLIPIGFISSACVYFFILSDKPKITTKNILSAIILGMLVSIGAMYIAANIVFVLGFLIS